MVESLCSSALQSCPDPIGNQFSYLHNYKSNFENLRAQFEKLRLVRQRVQHKIQVADRNGEEIDNEVDEWLNDVDKLIHKARRIIGDEWKGNMRSFGGLCPNLRTRHQLSKKAAREVNAIALLLSQGEKFHGISSRTIPKEISSLITSSRNPFSFLRHYKRYYENLRTEFEKLMDARERVQQRLEVSRRNGETIYEDVLKWVTNVEELLDDTRRTFEGFVLKAQTRCFIGLCPDLMTRHHLSNEAVRQLKAVAELRGAEEFDRISYIIIPPNIWLTSTKVYENFESRIPILEEIYNTLKDAMVNIIGVYGMAGIGKTVLLKQVAARVEAQKLFDVVIFAEITPTPNIQKIQGDIADHLGLMFHDQDVDVRAIKLFNLLKKENSILVMLDNIWTSLDLRRVGIPVGNDHRGCQVLLTSRNRNVLEEMGSQKNFKVGVLNEEEAFGLFKEIAGDSAKTQELQSLAIDITQACGGLPIAITSIAMALRGKDVFTWRDALRNLRRPSLSNVNGMLAEVYSSIKLSYDDLESEKLKSTFLLCSLMKSSGHVSITELLKYGIGVGLFEDMSIEEARNKVHLLVRRLESCCLLLDDHSSEWFTIHNVVRLVALSIASMNQHALTLRNEASDWLDKDAQTSFKAFSMHDSNITEFPKGLECPQLIFFSLLTKNPLMEIPDNFFTGMTKLNVLNLTKIQLPSLPLSFCLLLNLRTLCLEQCELGNIYGIGDLKNLEILNLSYSDIKFLPNDIGQLTRLRMLDVSNCSKLKVISPHVISSLSCLEELYMGNSFVQWGDEGLNFEGRNASLDELKRLSKLTSLEIHIKDAKILPKDLLSNKFKRYRILIGDEWDWFFEYETSRTLKLKLNTSILSEDGIIRQLNGIEELYLDDLQGVKNVLFELDVEGFPQLKLLHIQNNSSLQCIVDSMNWEPRDAFPHLESLFLHSLINLEKVFHGQFTAVSFCKLKIIKVEKCDKLKKVFSSSIARGLLQLQTLEVIECKNIETILDDLGNKKVTNKEVNIHSLTLKSLPQLRSCCLKVAGYNEAALEDGLNSNMPLFNGRVLFPMLEVLELAEINIQKIWYNRPVLLYYPIHNLRRLILRGCGKLKYIFTFSIFRSLLNLQHLEICHCASLEEVITIEGLTEKARIDGIFPPLECLVLRDLEKLVRLFSENCIQFPSLKQLKIVQCPQSKAFISTNLSTDSEEIQPFFNEKVAFHSLEEMVISGIDNLKMIWDNQLSEHSFQKLKLMEIKNCDKLLTVFPSHMCERFHQLESLTVIACNSLEAIFDLQNLNFEETYSKAQLKELHIHGLPKVRHIWKKDPQVMLFFPRLRIVRVSGCHNLENLFPASIARNLLELEELEIVNCGVGEIISKEERAEPIIRFAFPRITFIKFSMLQRLRCFYPGTHTSEWLVLKNLEVCDCDNVKIFTSKVPCDQLDVPPEQPLFMVDKVFPNLEELKLGGKVVAEIWQSTFAEHIFRRVEVVHIVRDQSDVFPLYAFQRFHNLEKLILSHVSYEEIFSHEKVEGHAKISTQIKELKLFELSNLKYMWKQESQLGTMLRKLEFLDVWWCSNLINLVPSSTSFHYLTVLQVWFCKRMKNLVAFSTAKTMVQLKEMKICGCEMMTEVVSDEGDVIEAEINFFKLKSLTLFCLENLTSFTSGYYNLKFPSLEELFVIECPNMNFFSKAVLSTPSLQEVQRSWAADVWCWDGDLNTTIQQLRKEVSRTALKKGKKEQEVEFKYPKNKHYPAEVTMWSDKDVMQNIKNKLTPRQQEIFQGTCFGRFLEFDNSRFSGVLVHSMLLREIVYAKAEEEEMWFNVDGTNMRFSRHEFGLITGLRFKAKQDIKQLILKGATKRIQTKFFPGIRSVQYSDLFNLFLNTDWSSKDDNDAVNIALLYCLHALLLGADGRKLVKKEYMQLVEYLHHFNRFPWGIRVWAMTFKSLSTALVKRYEDHLKWKKEKKTGDLSYSLMGFPLAFQVWIYESLGTSGKFCGLKDDSMNIPRLTKWATYEIPTWGDIYTIFKAPVKGKIVSVLKPTEAERSIDWYDDLIQYIEFGEDGDVNQEGVADDDDLNHGNPPSPMEFDDIVPLVATTSVDAPLVGQIGSAHPPPHQSGMGDTFMKEKVTDLVKELLALQEEKYQTMMAKVVSRLESKIQVLSEDVQRLKEERNEEIASTDAPDPLDIETTPITPQDQAKIIHIDKRDINDSIEGPLQRSPFPYLFKARHKLGRKVVRPSDVDATRPLDPAVHEAFFTWYMSDAQTRQVFFIGEVRRDFFEKLLTQPMWLNDGHIDGYLGLLRRRQFIYRSTLAQNWTTVDSSFNAWLPNALQQKATEGDRFQWPIMYRNFITGSRADLYFMPWSQVDMVYIPINIWNQHWVCGQLDLLRWTLTVYDSLITYCPEPEFSKLMHPLIASIPEMLQQSQYWTETRRDPHYEELKLHRLSANEVPQQRPDSGDCGVFTCKFIEYLSLGRPFNFTGDHGDSLRTKMSVELFLGDLC